MHSSINTLQNFGHVKWFVEDDSGLALPSFAHLVLIVFIVVAGYMIAKKLHDLMQPYRQKIESSSIYLRKYISVLITVSTGVLLIYSSRNGFLLAPNIQIGNGWLLWLQTLVGLMLLIGFGMRYVWLGALILYGAVLGSKDGLINILEHLELAAACIFVYVHGRGRYSLDYLYHIAKPSNSATLKRASNAYRILIGTSLMMLALTEKILGGEIGTLFLSTHNWNFLQFANVSDAVFVSIMGSLEFLFGLLLVRNLVPRLVVLAILGAMTTTAVVLGISEVFGHMFAVGLVGLVLIGYEHPDTNNKPATPKTTKKISIKSSDVRPKNSTPEASKKTKKTKKTKTKTKN